MKIVLKPLGALILALTILLLAYLSLRPNADPAATGLTPTPSSATPAAGATPTGEAAPIAGSTPMPLSTDNATREQEHAIFRDVAENGWVTESWTWAKDVSWDETKTVYAGKTAIRVRFNGYEGLKFHHDPLDMRPFNRISFYINGGPSGGQLVQIGAACSEKPCSNKGGVRLEPLPAGKWVAVTIPLEELELAGKPDVSAFWIQGSRNGLQEPVYVDEVRLLKPDEPAPQGVSIGRSHQAGN